MTTPTMTLDRARQARPTSARRSREGLFTALFLSMLMLIVVFMSIFVFGTQSLRLDEAQSLWQTSRTTAKMIEIVAEDVHVPLYHVLLHLWTFFLGNEVLTARLLSLIFAVLSIPLLYFLGKATYNRNVGLFAATLLAISPFFSWYSSEIRMYTLFALVTIANQYFFVRILRDTSEGEDTSIWWGYGIFAVLGAFTHYFFGLALLTQAIFYLAYRKKFPAHSLRRFIIVAAALTLLYVPWLAFVLHLGGASNTQPMLIRPTTVNLFNTFSQFVFGFQNDHINTIIVSLWPLSVLLVFLSLRKTHRISPESVYMLMCVALPIFIVFAISIAFKPIYLTRYLILSLPSLYLVISWLLFTYPARLSRILKIGLVLIMLGTLTVEAASTTTPVKENYRGAAEFLGQNVAPQDVIAVSAPFTVYPIDYYYRGPATILTLPLWDRYNPGPIPAFDEARLAAEVSSLKGDHQRLWMLMSYDQGYAENIRLYLDTHFERLGHRTFSPGLDLYVYKLRYDDSFTEPVPGLINDQTLNGATATTTKSQTPAAAAATSASTTAGAARTSVRAPKAR